ncbi:MAG TPA: CopG family transcriptional regulator [Chloroflexota bacterium]|jgi:Arc/MetJ-type ribon-helix-helix transcriptional regulator
MRRTTISLPDDLAGCVAREASRRRTSVSEVVRDALVAHLGLNQPRALPFTSLGRSGKANTAEEMEEILSREWAADIERHRDR